MMFPKPEKKIKTRKPLKRSPLKPRKTWLKKKRDTPRRTTRVIDRKFLDWLKTQPCDACGQRPGDEFNPIDPSHITTVKNHGGDTRDNVCSHCRQCHTKWGSWGISKFLKRYPRFVRWLREHGRFDILKRGGIETENSEGEPKCFI
jgi:hypothetical protein